MAGYYKIVTESTADLTPELIERFGIEVIPMQFTIDGVDYFNYPDNREISPQRFCNMLREGKTATTSAVNFEHMTEFLTRILEGGDDVLYMAFSSGLSSTYSTAVIVADELREKFPQRKIVVIDTLAASMGEGLFACQAASMMQNGALIDDVAKWAAEARKHICQWFTVDDLMHLYHGGRISAMSAHIGTALGMKPIIHVDDEGHLVPMLKIRGRKQAIEALAEKVAELGTDISEHMVFISHADAPDAAKSLADLIRERFSPREIQIGNIGPVIAGHAGPGTVALFFFGIKR